MTDYPTKSAHIRALASQGMQTADIARAVGVRYQHARNVLHAGKPTAQKQPSPPSVEKPDLTRALLMESGFFLAGAWREDDGALEFDGQLPKEAGVYAFCGNGVALYVGVATMGLAKRLYFYRRPGVTQTTSIRVRAELLDRLTIGPVEVLVATPAPSEWNGLPVDMNAGLELGLIKRFSLPWNRRGV